MSLTRRHLVKRSIAVSALGAMPRPLFAYLGSHPEPVPPIEDPRLKTLVDTSLDALTTAGASYGDIRLTHTYGRKIPGTPGQSESMQFGVRVIVDGYWGFASSPVWSPDEAVRLARAAVAQARANTLGKVRETALASVFPIDDGHWIMPVQDDPFAIHRDEILDFLSSLQIFIASIPHVIPGPIGAEFIKQDKAIGTTAGQYFTQRTYRSTGIVSFTVTKGNKRISGALDCLSPAGVGFELFRGQPLREYIRQEIEETKEDMERLVKPLDVGRYNVVLDASSIAQIVSQTIGAATELDRALGYEANAGGTSYITDPTAMLGTLKVGAPTLTVTADRSEAGSVATVKWDDEGVSPEPFTLVQDGMLVDMQTNREGAAWLHDYYAAQQQPVRSHGCASAEEAVFVPLTQTANLTLRPSSGAHTYASMIEAMDKGIAFKRMLVDMDFQQSSGLGFGMAYEVKNGKRTAILANAGILFRTIEFWKNLSVIGGQPSQRRFGMTARKGQPIQNAFHSVTSVPAQVNDVTVIDLARKA